MNDYYVGPGEYDFFYLNDDKKVEKFTTTVGYGIRSRAAQEAPTLSEPQKYKKFLYMKKVDDDSYAYLGSDHYDCVCLDKTGNLKVQRQGLCKGDICGTLFEFCRYSDDIYKVMKVTDATNGIEIKGLKEPMLEKGEYEVYYLGEDHKPLMLNYDVAQDKPVSFLFTLLEREVLRADVMCFINKQTGEMTMGAADYKVEYIDDDGKEQWSIVQSCRGDKIEEVLIDIYMSIMFTYREKCKGIKEMTALKYLGDDYGKSIFPIRKELLSLKHIKPFVGDFEKKYEKEIKYLNEEYRKELEKNRINNAI